MASYANADLLVETEWLAEHLSDPSLRVVDVRWSTPQRSGREAYQAGHIPGAVHIDVTSDIADPDSPIPVQIAPPDLFARRMGELGIGDDTLVIAYDDAGGTVAARLWWALLYYGHDSVRVLNGGIRKWTAENRPLSQETPSYAAAAFTPRPRPSLRCEADDVLAALNDPQTLILDARIEEQFREGHIPGSVNVPFPQTFVRGIQSLKAADELRQMYEQAGALKAQRVIATCGAGVAAAGAMFCLRLLGYDNVTVYDGSWNEWGRRSDLPKERG